MDEGPEDIDRKDDGNNTIEDQNSDIDFIYNDADEYGTEISELYSYSEEPEFELNRTNFEEDFYRYVPTKWFETSAIEQRTHIRRLLDRLESSKLEVRRRALRSLLYILQGNFGDWDLEEDQIAWTRRNVYMCIEVGLLPAVVQILLLETNYDNWSSQCSTQEADGNIPNAADTKDAGQCGAENLDSESETAQRTGVPCMTQSMDLRVILSILYTMVETVRDEMQADPSASASTFSSSDSKDSGVKLRESFCEELAYPILNDGKTTLTVILFGMVHRFCSGMAPHFPMKKVLLLLWKVLLVTLGPVTTLFDQKNKARARWNLPPLWENSHLIIRRVRAVSPPGISTDQLLSRNTRTNNRHTAFGQGNQVPRKGSLASGRIKFQQHKQSQGILQSYESSMGSRITSYSGSQAPLTQIGTLSHNAVDASGMATPRPGSPVSDPMDLTSIRQGGIDTPIPGSQESLDIGGLPQHQIPSHDLLADLKVLPWRPKVRKKDILMFLSTARMKFVNFDVPNDIDSLAGLPKPIHEAVHVMRQHLYVSLSEVQIQRENELARNPISMGREEIPDTPIERLYSTTYMQLPQYMIALLRVLLAAAPTSGAKTEPINILAEIIPATIPNNFTQTAIMNVDINRHCELIVKAISALLLLLLKHLKLNHVYQFEYVSQYLALANCIPLILKFFNQDTCKYVHAKNTLSFLDFPNRLIGGTPEITPELLGSDWSSYCWRNLFACINLLRILNMLTKWKPSRTLLLVVLKSASILKRALRVRHAMMQLYVLKLLKMQSRYFGRQWRRNSMSIMSAIYQMVRHRLTDDWAYGSDVDAAPWRLHLEEHALRASVEQFTRRRYTDDWLDSEFRPVDNCLTSVLNQPFSLSEEFKRNYEKWLEEEVFSAPINWSLVLAR